MLIFLIALGVAWFSFAVGFALLIGPWLDRGMDNG